MLSHPEKIIATMGAVLLAAVILAQTYKAGERAAWDRCEVRAATMAADLARGQIAGLKRVQGIRERAEYARGYGDGYRRKEPRP